MLHTLYQQNVQAKTSFFVEWLAMDLVRDADGDGITNLAEYAMGTAPGTPTTDPPLVIDPAGLAITMVRPRWLTGVQYLPEETTDFSSWNPVPLQGLATGTKTETVRASASR
jgi:hypothetical protein